MGVEGEESFSSEEEGGVPYASACSSQESGGGAELSVGVMVLREWEVCGFVAGMDGEIEREAREGGSREERLVVGDFGGGYRVKRSMGRHL